MTTNHPAHGPVSLDRLHQISEILSKAAAQSDGGNLGYAMADAVKVINGAIAAFGAEPVAWRYRYVHTPKTEEHGSPFTTEWKLCDSEDECNPSDCFERQPLYTAPPAPVVPDAIEPDYEVIKAILPTANPDEYACCIAADMWNACRAAMLQAGNHTEQRLDMVERSGDDNKMSKDGALINEGTIPATRFQQVADLYGITSPTGSETLFTFDAFEASDFAKGGWSVQEYVELERYQKAVAGNSPVIPDCYVLVPKELTCAMDDAAWEAYQETRSMSDIWAALLAAAPQQEVKSALEHGMQRYAGAMQKLVEGGD